jgi:hypothetical protein
MNCGLFIRFHYENDDPRWPWRLAYFKSMVLPRILNQKNGDFDIWIRCNPWHKDEIELCSPRIKTFQVKNEKVKYKKSGHKKYFHDFVKWADVIGVPRYDIQISVDSDDLVSKDFIDLMVKEIEKYKKLDSVHVHFQPETFYLSKLVKRPMLEYHKKRGSAFFALYQNNAEKRKDYFFIQGESHIYMWKHAQKSVVLPVGHCFATIHQVNESTGK